MVEELNFPLRFEKCTSCGGTKHLARTIGDEMIKKGTMTPGKPTGTNVGYAIIADPAKSHLTQTSVLKVYDVCVKCGHEHIVYLDSKETPIGGDPAQILKSFQQG